MTRKRGSGEGSIFKDGAGRWVGFVSLGFRNGKRWRKKFTGATEGEVKDKILDARKDMKFGRNIAPEKKTVGQFLDEWLETVVKTDTTAKTHRTYSDLVKLHITPALGRVQLAKLTPQQVKAFMNDKLKAGLSPRTVTHLRDTLRAALNVALKWELVHRNAAALVDPPRRDNHEPEVFSPEQAKQFLTCVKGHRLEALFSIAIGLGLREGEILGLRWKAIDFEKGILTVAAQLQRIDGKLIFVEPKTDKSRRKIALPQVAIKALLEHKSRQETERQFAGNRWQEHDVVFSTGIGTPMDARDLLRSYYSIIRAEDYPLPKLRFHDLRHSAATLLLTQGVHPRAVMDLLGHSRIATTMDTYSHVLNEVRRETANTMDAVFGGQKPPEVATENPVATGSGYPEPKQRAN